jgi:hypothetical protein
LRIIGHRPDDIGICEDFKSVVRDVFPGLPFVGQGRILFAASASAISFDKRANSGKILTIALCVSMAGLGLSRAGVKWESSGMDVMVGCCFLDGTSIHKGRWCGYPRH